MRPLGTWLCFPGGPAMGVSRAASAHLYRFSAPVRILSSLSICWWIRALWLCNAAGGRICPRGHSCEEVTGHWVGQQGHGGQRQGWTALGRRWARRVPLWTQQPSWRPARRRSVAPRILLRFRIPSIASMTRPAHANAGLHTFKVEGLTSQLCQGTDGEQPACRVAGSPLGHPYCGWAPSQLAAYCGKY